MRPRHILLVVTGAIGFCALVTLNSGGYHYGVSDQAFYIPVVLHEIDPHLFPHDGALLDAQDRLLFFDDWFAPIVKVTGVSLPVAFLVGQIVTLLVLYGAIIGVGRALYSSWWTVGGLAVLMTIRHRIPHTSANSVEGYFHPRMLAFAIGMSATALYLSGRTRLALVVVGAALLTHPTTGLWFALLVGGAAMVRGDVAVRPVVTGLAVATAVGVWVLGPGLWDQLVVMDAMWLRVLTLKDYLVIGGWPLAGWFSNLAITAFVLVVYRYRRSLGVAREREGALVAGCGLLLGFFLLSAPFSYASVALAVQLLANRVFWVIDAVGVVLLAWLLFESPLRVRVPRVVAGRRSRRALVVLIALLALWRGGYRGFVEGEGQPVIQVGRADSDWGTVMSWAATQPIGTLFLADPVHAARYGTSVRADAGRDVYLELFKDSGVAIYSSAVAHRVARRIEDLGDFEQLTAKRARDLATQYEIDFLITERSLDLPVATREGPLVVYALRR